MDILLTEHLLKLCETNKTVPYLYKWVHLPTGKWYIGSKTQTNWTPLLHEKYICSSEVVRPLIESDRGDWVYEILAIGSARYLIALDAKNDPMSFNRSNAVFDPGNRLGRKESAETRLKKSLARRGDKNPMYGKRGILSPHYGKKHSEESKDKTREKLRAYAKTDRLSII